MKRLLLWCMRLSLLLVLGALATPFLVPLDRFRPQLEHQLSQLSGRYVRLGALRLEILPQPALYAEAVSFWGHTAAQSSPITSRGELYVQRLALHPDMGRLLFERRLVLRHIALHGVAVNEALLRNLVRRLRAQQATPSDGDPAWGLESLAADPMTIRLQGGQVLGPYRMRLQLHPDNRLREIDLMRRDGSLQLHLEPRDKGFALTLKAVRWTLPLPPPLQFDALQAAGLLTPQGVSLDHVQARAYGGRIEGQARLQWQDDWRLDAHLRSTGVHMAPLIRLFGGSGFRGDFHGDLEIRLQAADATGIFRNPLVQGPFRITNGVVGSDPSRPLLVFQSFAARGRLDRAGIDTWGNLLQAYGGRAASTHLRLRWQPQWRLEGTVEVANMDSEALLAGFLEQRALAGRLSGQTRLALAGDTFQALFLHPQLQARIHLQDGRFYRADLEKAGSSLGRESAGETRFQDLHARIRMTGGHTYVEDLHLGSRALQATGAFQVDESGNLSGHLDVGLKHTGFLTSIPLVVSGHRDDPHLRPSKAVLLGGVAGSGLWGPGIGTALGIKLGETVEKFTRLLRRNSDDPRDAAADPADNGDTSTAGTK